MIVRADSGGADAQNEVALFLLATEVYGMAVSWFESAAPGEAWMPWIG